MRAGYLKFLSVFLVCSAFLLCNLVFAAEQLITATLERKADLILNVNNVDLGTPLVAVGSQYYEKINAVRVSFRCNARTSWEVRLSGTDFVSGTSTIPITQLNWRKSGTGYVAFPPAGSYAVIAKQADYPKNGANWHDEYISYRLNLTGDEFEGTYQATLTYTLFVP